MPVENFNFFTAFCYFRIASICQVVAAASFLSHLFFLSASSRVASFFFCCVGPARARRGDDGTAAPLTPPCRRRSRYELRNTFSRGLVYSHQTKTKTKPTNSFLTTAAAP